MTLAVNIAQGGSNNVTMRNRIINGAMVIDQRNAGAVVTATNVFTVDRWAFYQSTAGTLTAQQVSDAPTNYVNSLKITTAVAKSTAAGDYFNFNQKIEGYNIADLNWGTANALSVTLSFWVKSSLTGTFGGSLENNDNTYSYVFQYTISSANTWEQKTITIAGPSVGTWQKTTSAGILVLFSMGDGSTYSTATPNTWVSGDYRNINTNVRISANAGATWQVTGVQLEAGTTASPFEYRQYGTELALCQRYYEKLSGAGTAGVFGSGAAGSTTDFRSYVRFSTPKRATPTISFSAANTFLYQGTSTTTPSAITSAAANTFSSLVSATGTYTAGQAYTLLDNISSSTYIASDSEL